MPMYLTARSSGGVAPIAVHREGRLGPPEQHRGRREVLAPRRRARAYVPASAAERADGRSHRAHELVQTRAYKGAQTLPARRIASDRSDRGDARIAVAVRAHVASEQGRGRSEGGADRSMHHG